MALTKANPLSERLWGRVEVTDAGCWEYRGYIHSNGYGQLYNDGRKIYAHRAAYLLSHGILPDGGHVLHRCDNPPCVNPTHLFLGDQAANYADMLSKGRHYKWKWTHCPNGHEYTAENILPARPSDPVGIRPLRRCRACSVEGNRGWKERRRHLVAA